MSTRISEARYRWRVASRVLAAGLGGYALASVVTVLTSLLWPMPLPKAILASNMLSFIWYALAIIWVFSVHSLRRAWLGILIPTFVLGLWCWYLLPAVPLGELR